MLFQDICNVPPALPKISQTDFSFAGMFMQYSQIKKKNEQIHIDGFRISNLSYLEINSNLPLDFRYVIN